MSEKSVSTGMVKKWDEVRGVTTRKHIETATEGTGDVGVGPSISRNYMRGIEDMVEQNDNNFDGVINNIESPKPVRISETEKKEKCSVIEKLLESQNVEATGQTSMHERKPIDNSFWGRKVL